MFLPGLGFGFAGACGLGGILSIRFKTSSRLVGFDSGFGTIDSTLCKLFIVPNFLWKIRDSLKTGGILAGWHRDRFASLQIGPEFTTGVNDWADGYPPASPRV